MQKKQLPPVSMVKEDISEFYAITTDIFHVHHLYVTQKINSKKKVVGFLSFKTQPNLMYRNFKVCIMATKQPPESPFSKGDLRKSSSYERENLKIPP